MATQLQIAANRRNAKKSTGPRSAEGKQAVRMNALKHGMTAQVIVLPHENAVDYHEIRAALIDSYKPANAHELMYVDQIAVGYWRTIRARRFETAMFDNQVRAYKRKHDVDESPNAKDDEACAVILQCEDPQSLKNYFRYDSSISRDYYRAVQALERAQNARRRDERVAQAAPPVRKQPSQTTEEPPLRSIGFVSQASSRNPALTLVTARPDSSRLLNLSFPDPSTWTSQPRSPMSKV